MLRATACFCILLFAPAAGCDRDSAPPTPVTTVPERRTLEIRPIAALLPARRTHVAVDPRGNVFWSQEGEAGDDVVFSVGDDGVPRATALTAPVVIGKTGEAAGDPATANVQSLAFGPDGALYFFVSGGTSRRTIAVLGRYVPSTSTIELIAPTKQLMAAAGMGRSIALARGTLVASGKRVVFWLRHTDTSIMFDIGPRAGGAGGGGAELKRAPEVRTDLGPLRLTRENQFLAASRDGSLLLLDLASAQLSVIDTAGRATVLQDLAGLPQALSLPALDARGRVLLAAGQGPPISPGTEAQAGLSSTDFPALLTLDGRRTDVLPRGDIAAHSGFPLAGMKLQQLVPDRTNDGYVAYDESSGELLRLRIRGGNSAADERR